MLKKYRHIHWYIFKGHKVFFVIIIVNAKHKRWASFDKYASISNAKFDGCMIIGMIGR
jgi:hypothetical protein